MFRPAYNFQGGGEPVQKGPYTVKALETITQGMICKLTTGEVEPADSNDATFAGFAVADAAAGAEVYLYDISAVMSVVDANARIDGAALDVDTGSQSVTTKSNVDLVVVRTSASSEDTLIMIHPQKNLYFVST